jgi:hypothetical protein
MRACTRRTFFRGMGAAAIALPFIRLLATESAKAQQVTTKRLVIFATPNGTVMDQFWPASDCSFGSILRPLEPFRQKLLVMRGIDMKSAYKTPVPKDHLPDFSNLLTAMQPAGQDYGQMSMTGISIDQEIANAIGDRTKFRVLNLGVQTTEPSYPMLSTGPGAMFLPESSPRRSFDRLFADISAEPSELDRVRAERRSILDLVGQEVSVIRCELGSEDRPRLDAHLESIRELERSLSFNASVACTPPVLEADLDVQANQNFPAVGKMQMDIVAAALACDRTRVITLQWSSGASKTHHTWVGVDFTHHGVSHGSEGVSADENTRRGWLISIENWYAQQFLYLLQKLDAISDGGGTLLDSTAVVWMHEQSNGGSHSRNDMPYVLAGSCGGYFGTGRCLHLGGKPHNNLLISLANAMDVPLTSFGDGNSSGPLEELRA